MDFKLNLDPDKTQADMYENINYQDFWMGVERQHLDKLEQVLIQQMLKLPARRLVDIGCGFGRLSKIYMNNCQEVVMVDSSLSQLLQAREITGGRCTYIASNATRLPFQPGSFDRALMIRVFHHIPKEAEKNSLNELERILCQNGQLLFTYSNKRNLERIVKWLFGKLPYNPFELSTAAIWEPFSMHHPRYISQALSERGFCNLDLRGSGVMDKIAGRLGKFGNLIPLGVQLAPFFGRSALAPWIFVGCKKKTGTIPAVELAKEFLQCPVCAGGLATSYECPTCNRVFPILDGVIDFRTD
jgi:ubiquinone/menaquinone biosynthesis C-methylase UbiE